MYLFIHEDGQIVKGNTITQADIDASANGIVEIIKISVINYGDEVSAEILINDKWYPVEAL